MDLGLGTDAAGESTLGGTDFARRYLAETTDIISRIDLGPIERLVDLLVPLQSGPGRLFVVGSGGGAGHASHAVNDFRKILGIEAYTPSDNVSELTARVNDEGWEHAYSSWLVGSRIRATDVLLVLSVGGGDLERNVSPNLVHAIDVAERAGAAICGIVGRDGGYTARRSDACVVIPEACADRVTPHVEGLQAVIWHLVVTHPRLRPRQTRWESLS